MHRTICSGAPILKRFQTVWLLMLGCHSMLVVVIVVRAVVHLATTDLWVVQRCAWSVDWARIRQCHAICYLCHCHAVRSKGISCTGALRLHLLMRVVGEQPEHNNRIPAGLLPWVRLRKQAASLAR
jgi:hypothetical protein